jgi:hypothetical protein
MRMDNGFQNPEWNIIPKYEASRLVAMQRCQAKMATRNSRISKLVERRAPSLADAAAASTKKIYSQRTYI